MMQCLKRLVYELNKPRYIASIKRRFSVSRFTYCYKHDSDILAEPFEDSEEEKNIYSEISKEYLGSSIGQNRVFIIQPYIKWGVNKKRNTTPQLQLEEAVALISTLSDWTVVGKRLVPLLSLQRHQLVGSGALENLQTEIANAPNVTAIFVSTNMLKFVQIASLQKYFNLPIYDRYSIVIHIFREHARTVDAKLQVALAELPYIKQKMIDFSQYRIGRINYNEKTKNILQKREKKLKQALKKLKEHRHMIKQQRSNYAFPTIAVVGYTNAGKTSLIKALTGDDSLYPENKLFATLDTTVHQGFLSNRLKVLYVDTIGFIQDVPEVLLAPFTVTLEDAINADILVHVFDISHPDTKAQIQHVQKTIRSMVEKGKTIINVANKCDMINKDPIDKDILPEGSFTVSAVKLIGIDSLKSKIEELITNSPNLIKKRIRVRTGSAAASWLYKETTVLDAEPDPKNQQLLIMNVYMTTPVYYKFKRTFKV